MKDNYLIHYGILGMKWGIRRYQNEDGTFTSAGKNRYSYSDKRSALKNYKKKTDEWSKAMGYFVLNKKAYSKAKRQMGESNTPFSINHPLWDYPDRDVRTTAAVYEWYSKYGDGRYTDAYRIQKDWEDAKKIYDQSRK